MKILLVHNFYQVPGGEDTVVENERRLIEEHGHQVVSYSRGNNEVKNFSVFRKLILPFIVIFNPKTYHDIRNIIVKEKIDIVHVHNTFFLISPAVYYASLSCKVPIVQTVHNFRLLCPAATFYRNRHICEECVEKGLLRAVKFGCYRDSRLQTALCVAATFIHRKLGIYRKINYICMTKFNREKLLLLNQGGRQMIDPKKVFIKPHFTFGSAVRKEVGDFYLYMGRIDLIKGVGILLEVFEQMPEYRLILAGSGPQLEYYEEDIKRKKCGNIEFVGYKKRRELTELLQKAKAVIVVSQCYETFGMVVVEAFAKGVPVIVGDIGNVGGLVEDGINGIKFQFDSATSLADAIYRFEQSDWERMGREAYKTYKALYSEMDNYVILHNIYDKILQRT